MSEWRREFYRVVGLGREVCPEFKTMIVTGTAVTFPGYPYSSIARTATNDNKSRE